MLLIVINNVIAELCQLCFEAPKSPIALIADQIGRFCIKYEILAIVKEAIGHLLKGRLQ